MADTLLAGIALIHHPETRGDAADPPEVTARVCGTLRLAAETSAAGVLDPLSTAQARTDRGWHLRRIPALRPAGRCSPFRVRGPVGASRPASGPALRPEPAACAPLPADTVAL